MFKPICVLTVIQSNSAPVFTSSVCGVVSFGSLPISAVPLTRQFYLVQLGFSLEDM